MTPKVHNGGCTALCRFFSYLMPICSLHLATYMAIHLFSQIKRASARHGLFSYSSHRLNSNPELPPPG